MSSTTSVVSTGVNPMADSTGLLALGRHADFKDAVPTPDHFLPVLYLAGLADAAGSVTRVLVDGYTYGSLSMTAYTLGLDHEMLQTAGTAAAPLPDPDAVPTDETNT
jgi:4,5-DOPA dioxygenase extradiol